MSILTSSPLPVGVDTQYKNTVVEDEEKDTRNHSGPGYDRRRRRRGRDGGKIYLLEFHCVKKKGQLLIWFNTSIQVTTLKIK